MGIPGIREWRARLPRRDRHRQRRLCYITDAGNDRVQKFTSDGVYLATLGGPGTGDGQVDGPWGIAIAGSAVFVTDTGHDRIHEFTTQGAHVATWGAFGFGNGQFVDPRGIAVGDDGTLFVADHVNNRIQQFTSAGAFVTKWGSDGTADGQFNFPKGIAVDGDGNVYVADTFSDRIQKFEQNAQNPLQYDFVTKWGTTGDGDDEFDHPSRVAVDASGDVYVADNVNGRIQRFRQDDEDPLEYNLIATIGSEGDENGEFSFPEAVAFDAAEHLYVVDWGNHRIQIFAPLDSSPRLKAEAKGKSGKQRRGRKSNPRKR